MKNLNQKLAALISVVLVTGVGCIEGTAPLDTVDPPPDPIAECGNGIVEPGEDCDDGQVTTTCTDTCRVASSPDSLNNPTGVYGDPSPQHLSPLTKAAVFGQPNFTDRVNISAGVSYPWNSHSDGTRYFVADTGNNRILIWTSTPDSDGQSPDLVIGQPDMTTTAWGTDSASLREPTWVHSDGTRLYVADSSNNRVLIWNTIPTSNGVAADVVLGQPTMTSSTANNGGRSAQTMAWPMSVATAGTKLLVADWSNNRVLVWNTIPTASQQAADVVVGQPDMASGTANNGGVTATSLYGPYHASSDGTRLFVSDFYNRRVLMWNTIPTADQTAANIALGQPDMTSRVPNNGGISSQSLEGPGAVATNGTAVVVSDYANHRVLIWSTMPTTTAQAADVVLGQASMSSNSDNSGGISTSSLSWPWGVSLNGNALTVADYGNNRLLMWDTIPTVNQSSANVVLGQATATTNGVNNGGGTTASSVRYPAGVTGSGAKLIVSDYLSHRILIWNTVSSINNLAADVVIGQTDMVSATENSGGLSSTSLRWPMGIETDGTKLFAADTYNNRILVWNAIPTVNNAAADIVLGQPDMTSNSANATNASLQTLNTPTDVASDGHRLFVADAGNNRVLIWNEVPTSTQTPADVVLGQPDAVSTAANNGGIGAGTMSWPAGVASDGTRLYVADAMNNRVLVWNTIPTTSATPADFVLGQPDFVTSTENTGGVTGSSLAWPCDVHSDGVKVFVVDSSNHRILVWNAAPTTTAQTADDVMGQTVLTSNLANSGGRSADTTYEPAAVYFDSEWALVADSANDRVLSLQ